MANLAGVVAEYLQSHPGDVPLDDLVRAVNAAGLNRSLEQVYAGVQSMASTGKCGRGHGKRTYCRLADTAPDRVVEPGTSPRRTQRSVATTYLAQDVYNAIETVLGPPVPRPQYDKVFAVILLGEDSPEYILERAEIVLKRKPTAWCQWSDGLKGCDRMLGFIIDEA